MTLLFRRCPRIMDQPCVKLLRTSSSSRRESSLLIYSPGLRTLLAPIDDDQHINHYYHKDNSLHALYQKQILKGIIYNIYLT